MAQAVLAFNEQVERIGEVIMVVMVGGMLSSQYLPTRRSGSSRCCCGHPAGRGHARAARRAPARPQRRLIGWFGIRGIGSIYYLMYAIKHGLAAADDAHARRHDAVDGGRLDRRPRRLGLAADGGVPPQAGTEARGRRRRAFIEEVSRAVLAANEL